MSRECALKVDCVQLRMKHWDSLMDSDSVALLLLVGHLMISVHFSPLTISWNYLMLTM